MTNAEIREIVFNKINEFGFKVYNVQNVDGYFIFEGAKDSITHFRIKGKGMWKHWKFGLWLNEEYMSENELNEAKERHENGDWEHDPKVIQLFAQHDTWTDKFKPSRCNLLVEIDNDSLYDYIMNEANTFYKVEHMLNMMVRHPFMCYDEYCGEYVGFTDKSFFFNYISSEFKKNWDDFKKFAFKTFWFPYTKTKIALCKHSNVVDNIILYDFEKENEGWSTDYLYEVRITFSHNATDEEMIKWLNRWWKHKEYGKYGYYDKVISVDSFRQVGKKEWFVFTED